MTISQTDIVLLQQQNTIQLLRWRYNHVHINGFLVATHLGVRPTHVVQCPCFALRQTTRNISQRFHYKPCIPLTATVPYCRCVFGSASAERYRALVSLQACSLTLPQIDKINVKYRYIYKQIYTVIKQHIDCMHYATKANYQFMHENIESVMLCKAIDVLENNSFGFSTNAIQYI